MNDKIIIQLMKKTEVIILSAGKGSRMKSDAPKILLEIEAETIFLRIVKLLKANGFKEAIFVLGYKSDSVISSLKELDFGSKIDIQSDLNGTAKALELGLNKVDKDTQNVLVLYGDDAGLYKPSSIKKLIKGQDTAKNIATFMILKDHRVSDIGGLEVNSSGEVLAVRSMKQISDNPKSLHYVLCGAFCFDFDWIKNNINKIKVNPISGEYPLPQIVEIARNQKLKIQGIELINPLEWESVNTPNDLNMANKKKYVQMGK